MAADVKPFIGSKASPHQESEAERVHLPGSASCIPYHGDAGDDDSGSGTSLQRLRSKTKGRNAMKLTNRILGIGFLFLVGWMFVVILTMKISMNRHEKTSAASTESIRTTAVLPDGFSVRV